MLKRTRRFHKYLLEKLRQQVFPIGTIISGRRNPPEGGVIISNSLALQEFKDLLNQDPFTQAGVAHYEILEFTPTFCAPGILENR